MIRAVFLDRDNTLIEPVGFRSALTPEEVVLKPGVAAGLKLMKDTGLLLVVVTNQGRIETKELTVQTLHRIHDTMNDAIIVEGGPKIDAFYWCPHKNVEGRGRHCVCGKPQPGMFYAASRDLSINLQYSYMIGDDERDMQAASNACIGSRIFLTEVDNKSAASEVASNFYKAAQQVAFHETRSW